MAKKSADPFKDIEINLGNTSLLFKNRNKISRRNNTELRRRPTNERFRTNQHPSRMVILRLKINLKLLAGYSRVQILQNFF